MKFSGNLFFLVALGLINLLLFMLLISSVAFTFKIPISFWHFPIAILGLLIFNFYLIRNTATENQKELFLKSSLLILLVIITSIFTAKFFYDYTGDGQRYHMEAIIQLKEGWNPFHTYFNDPNFNILLFEHYDNNVLWINHYAKGAEIPQAVIYAFTERIESGKSTNIILLFASLFLCISFFGKFRISNFKVFILSVFFAFNPVVVNQLLSTYVDGQLASLLLCLLIAACLLVFKVDKVILFLFSSIIIILLNIKFTSIIYTGVFITALLFLVLYQKRIKDFKKIFLAGALSSFIAILLVGFNPYITNTINKGHPFYPLAGKEKVDILTHNYPLSLKEKNRFERLFISLFAETGGASFRYQQAPALKFPFILSKNEVLNSSKVDNRTGGFGIFFSGILILSFLTLMVLIFHFSKSKNFKYLYIILSIIFVSIFVISESWWARYAPQIYFIPLIILFFAENYNQKVLNLLKNITYFLIFLNILLLGLVTLRKNIVVTMAINHQLEILKEQNHQIFVDYNVFRSNRVRFSENGIKAVEKDLKGEEKLTEIAYSGTKVYLPPDTFLKNQIIQNTDNSSLQDE